MDQDNLSDKLVVNVEEYAKNAMIYQIDAQNVIVRSKIRFLAKKKSASTTNRGIASTELHVGMLILIKIMSILQEWRKIVT